MRSYDQQVTNMILFAISILAWAGALIVAGTHDLEDEQASQDHYCQMVALWEADSHLPPEQRAGWPPYEGGCDGAQ